MAIEVIRVYKEHFPALRLIGKRYTNKDRGQDGFGKQWDAWMMRDQFAALKRAVGILPFDEDPLGLMTMRADGTDFAYWIGLFFPAQTQAPEGYDFLDLPKSDIAVGWVRGNPENGEIYGGPPHEAVCKKIRTERLGNFRSDIAGPDSGVYCFFERYHRLRFHEMDADGNVILDYGNYIV